jgi:hypothetical protein
MAVHGVSEFVPLRQPTARQKPPASVSIDFAEPALLSPHL